MPALLATLLREEMSRTTTEVPHHLFRLSFRWIWTPRTPHVNTYVAHCQTTQAEICQTEHSSTLLWSGCCMPYRVSTWSCDTQCAMNKGCETVLPTRKCGPMPLSRTPSTPRGRVFKSAQLASSVIHLRLIAFCACHCFGKKRCSHCWHRNVLKGYRRPCAAPTCMLTGRKLLLIVHLPD